MSSDADEREDEGGGTQKLTRAQRKRLRKKKLKQAASQPRRKIIGPLLPTSTTACEGGGDAVENAAQGVGQNAAEGNASFASGPGDDDFMFQVECFERNRKG